MDEEIRQAVSEVREMKQMCGNINMKLTNIVTQRGQDFKKKLEAEYQRGLEEGREQMPCDTCAYRHNKLLCADCKWTYGSRYKVDSIGVGDIIANNTEPKLKVWVTCFDEIGFCGIAITDFGTVDGGKLYSSCSPKGWHKIGHFDIAKILEAMKND